jgi:hypothetical protein
MTLLGLLKSMKVQYYSITKIKNITRLYKLRIKKNGTNLPFNINKG